MSYLITDPAETNVILAEYSIAQYLGASLKHSYPGRNWIVKVDMEGGMASVHCPDISMDYGCSFYLDNPLKQIQDKAIYYAGELLERFRLSRETVKEGDIDNLPRTPLGFIKRINEGGY